MQSLPLIGCVRVGHDHLWAAFDSAPLKLKRAQTRFANRMPRQPAK